MIGKDMLAVEVSYNPLEQCVQACKAFLSKLPQRVEVGGVMIGTFDGYIASIEELLLDQQADCTPTNIRLTPNIFDQAEKAAAQRSKNSLDKWFVLGTWHGHPPGYDTFSSTDERMLFREHMLLRTDDPSLALAPRVHFIFPDYGLETGVKAFRMKLRSEYLLKDMLENGCLQESWSELVAERTNLGVLVTKTENEKWKVKTYHPDTFASYPEDGFRIRGLWKYFPFAQIDHEFEKIFLENFFQKTLLDTFEYVRTLHQGNTLINQWFECQRKGSVHLSKVVRFVEVPIRLREESGKKNGYGSLPESGHC